MAQIQLTPVMQRCLEYMREHGNEIHRYAGGYWARNGWYYNERPYFGDRTIIALNVRRLISFRDCADDNDGRQMMTAVLTEKI